METAGTTRQLLQHSRDATAFSFLSLFPSCWKGYAPPCFYTETVTLPAARVTFTARSASAILDSYFTKRGHRKMPNKLAHSKPSDPRPAGGSSALASAVKPASATASA